MIPPALHLYGRPTGDGAHMRDLTPVALGWKRTTHATYGYLSGTFTLAADAMPADEIVWLYHAAIGCTVKESVAGRTSWEGLVWEMRLHLGGATFVRTLDPEWFANKVKVTYSTATDSNLSTAFLENTDSSDMYGEMQYIDVLGSATADAASALQARRLAECAWPRSRMVGAVTVGAPQGAVSLDVTVLGYWATLNWRYATTDTTDTASAQVAALVALSEFVTAGRVETNALSVRVNSAERPLRLGDAIAAIVGQGDASGNVWQGGVYAGRKLRYEQAPTTASHYLQRGRLLDRGMAPPEPALVEPGILVRNLDAPMGWPSYGTDSAWDDPAIGYVEQVEYAAPGALTLTFADRDAQGEALSARMDAGSWLPRMDRVTHHGRVTWGERVGPV